MKYLCAGVATRTRYDVVTRYTVIRQMDDRPYTREQLFDMLEHLHPAVLGTKGEKEEKPARAAERGKQLAIRNA